MFPGNLFTGTLTQVLKPTVVNEFTAGFSQNHWGFKRQEGPIQASDYTTWYRGATNPLLDPSTNPGQVMPDPPRLAPFGAYGEPHLTNAEPGSVSVLPVHAVRGRQSVELRLHPAGGLERPAAAVEPELPVHLR